MNRLDLIYDLVERTDMNVGEVEKVVNALPDAIIEGLMTDNKVWLKGVITLEVYTRQGRKIFNPHTGKNEKYPPKLAVRCKIGKKIMDVLDTVEVEDENDEGET